MPSNAKAIVIGGSAGALEALNDILPALPGDFPLPVAVVVHLPSHKESIMAKVLQERCKMTIQEAEDKDMMRAGHVYFAPPDYHLLIEHGGGLALSSDEPVHYSRPSIDVLFETAADAYAGGLTAVLLSGANEDGAAGIGAVFAAGGRVIVQDLEQASSPLMPESALKICPQAEVLKSGDIASVLVKEYYNKNNVGNINEQ